MSYSSNGISAVVQEQIFFCEKTLKIFFQNPQFLKFLLSIFSIVLEKSIAICRGNERSWKNMIRKCQNEHFTLQF